VHASSLLSILPAEQESNRGKTCAVVNWLPIFGNPAIAQIILDSLRFLHDRRRMTLHAYVLIENHLHLIVSAEDLPKEMGDFKSFTAFIVPSRAAAGSRTAASAMPTVCRPAWPSTW
jgi:hypothetical protein